MTYEEALDAFNAFQEWSNKREDLTGCSHHLYRAFLAGINNANSQDAKVAAKLDKLKAENERLRGALLECRDEIDGYIRQEYPSDHPVHERCRARDFSANPARIALSKD